MSRLYDTSGKVITRKRQNRSLFLSMIGGATCSIWFIINAPQQILTLLVKNTLGATSTQLGIFVGLLNAVSIFHLVSVIIYSKASRVKPTWLTFGAINRSLSFVIGAALFYAASGGSHRVTLMIVMVSSTVTFIVSNCGSSGWWAWINGIVPSQIRSTYFGKRSALSQILNVIAFLSTTLALDFFSSATLMVFGIIYTAAGVFGLLEVILHIPVPEAAGTLTPASGKLTQRFFAPVRNKNFRTFSMIAGVSLLAVNIANTFFVPMITSPDQIGAPVIWIGIMYAISQLMWVVVIPFWGTLMDRFGTKSVTMVGMLFPLTFIGYLFLTPDNYHFLLPVISVLGGLVSPALYEGLSQTMMSLLPIKDRTTFIGWFWALLGLISAIGSIIGGLLLDLTGSMTVLVIGSIGVMAVAMLVFDTVKTWKHTKFSAMLTTATSPSVVRSYLSMPILGKSSDRNKVERTLQSVKDSRSTIVIEEIAMRLEDADADVREEAVRALGRIGSWEAAEILIETLHNKDSLVRGECARALGKMRWKEAVPALVEALGSDDNTLVEIAARALGKIDSSTSSEALLGLIEGDYSLKIKITSAAGLSERQERISVLQETLTLYTQTHNPVMHKQLAISIANILGKPGEFYQYVTGTEIAREEATQRLFKHVYRNMRQLPKGNRGIIDHIIKFSIPAAISSFEAEEYQEAFETLRTILLQLIYRHIKVIGDTDNLSSAELDELYGVAPNLYAGYVTMRWLKDKEQVCTDLEVLLLFYVLKWYRKKSPLVE